MADYILIRKSRNIISSILHVVLNILLGVGSILLTMITGWWVLGMLLVILSKWRMFAVRPRYWLLNLKSNLVDLIVGASFVLLAYCAGTTWMPIHAILAVLYSLWLVILKPRSSELATELQAIVAVFLGTTAATELFASNNSAVLVLVCFLIGFAASRHILAQSEDSDFALVAIACGLISAEIAWLCHSWLIVYTFAGTGIIIPQLSLILAIFAFVSDRVYASGIKNDGRVIWRDVATPVIFSLLIIAFIVLAFSKPIFNV